jgi:hypothetical protein
MTAHAAKRRAEAAPPPPAPPAGASISGQVTISELPAPKKVAVTRDADKCGREKADETYVWAANKGLRNVVVWIDAPAPAGQPPRAAQVRAITCVFEPHVTVASVGATLEVRNFDTLQHAVHGWLSHPLAPTAGEGPLSLLNAPLPVKGSTVRKTLEQPGLIKLENDSGRPWMQAYVWVFDHPFAAVSDEVGQYQIDGVPDGDYAIHAWHEAAGLKTGHVTIKDHGAQTFDFAF